MAKITDLGEAKVPGVGKVNVFSPKGLVQLFLGVVVVLIMFPFANRAANAASSYVNKLVPAKANSISADSPGYVILGQ